MKYAYRRVPFEMFDIENIESFLSSLSEKGLKPVSVYRNNGFVKCEKGEKCPSRVRLEPMKSTEDELPEELSELYEASGWEYLGVMGRFYHVFITFDESAPEPYSDEDFRSELFSKILRRLRRELIGIAVIIAVVAGIIIATMNRKTPLLSLVNGGLWRTVYLVVLLALLLVLEIKNFASVMRLKKRLKKGLPPRRNRRFTAFGMTLRRIFTALVLILGISWYVLLFFPHHFEDFHEVTEADSLPFPTLCELSPEAEPGGFKYDGIDYANTISVKRDLIVTRIYDLLQEDYPDSETDRKYKLDVELYECKYPRISRRIAEELVGEIKLEQETVWQEGEYYIKYYKNPDDGYQILSIFTAECAARVSYLGESDLASYALDFAGL